jgi:hypothetical protein
MIGLPVACSAGIADAHLFAFDITGETADEDHYIGSARGIQCFLQGGLGTWLTPGEPHLGVAIRFEIFELELVGLAAFEIDESAFAGDARVGLPAVTDDFAVDIETEAVVGAHHEFVLAGSRGQ